NVSRMSTMSADEASHWDELHMGYHVDRVNHSEIYSDHGKHTNMVESYVSRLRRMVSGQQHHVSPQYLHQYANHAAWLEDNRRTDNGTLAQIVVSGGVWRRIHNGGSCAKRQAEPPRCECRASICSLAG
ncbi:MAG: transposase, partial [Sedimentitalea sp.]